MARLTAKLMRRRAHSNDNSTNLFAKNKVFPEMTFKKNLDKKEWNKRGKRKRVKVKGRYRKRR